MNPNIRDPRSLHEIYHAATTHYVANANLLPLEAKAFNNERRASTFTEMAVYLEFPGVRPLNFEHPIFVDWFLFPQGDFGQPDATLVRRWKSEPELVFQELMYARVRAVSAADEEIDPADPQIVWLRRHGEQGANWIRVWAGRYQQVKDAMITLRECCAAEGRAVAARQHLDQLLSPEIAEGFDVPFRREAEGFRDAFDTLIATYGSAKASANQTAVKHRSGA